MRVDRRRRRKPDGLPDVPHRRRVPVARRVALDEVEDLLLALRQILPNVHPVWHLLHSCRTCVRRRYLSRRTDSTLRASRAILAVALAPMAELVDAPG